MATQRHNTDEDSVSTHAPVNVKAKRGQTTLWFIILEPWAESCHFCHSWTLVQSKRHECLSQREQISAVLHIGKKYIFEPTFITP